MTNSLPWKDPPFLRTVNHLFLWAHLYHGKLLNNQMVRIPNIFGIFTVNLISIFPVVPHKAVAEVSKIGNLKETLAVVNQGWQSESTDGPQGA